MELGAPELVIILVIVILLFGVGRIGKIAGELGTGVRAFREGLRDEPSAADKAPADKEVQETTEVAKAAEVEVPVTGEPKP